MRASTAITILCLAAEVALSVALPLPASNLPVNMQKVIDPTKMPYEETSLYVPPVHQNLPPLREVVEQYEWIRPLPPTPTLPTPLAPPHQQQPAIPGPPAAMHPKHGLSGRGSGSAPESQPP